ncbi:MAG: toll/interleukin-1 receptor domain-containing protein [Phycisphaerales bacterium]|nr:toll/interleukin-1 receptor domain-containing protein [Phycisphaerales bacterium]
MQPPSTHDIFISHSIKDKESAEAVCAALEQAGLRCWIAPRDVLAGVNWGSAILGAINSSRAMVLVFSSHANHSPHVLREVERAVHHGVPIIPLRIEDVPPADALEFFISVQHWLDATTGPLESHLDALIATLHRLLAESPRAAATTAPPPPLPAARHKRNRWILPLAFLIMFSFLGSIALTTWLLVRKHRQVAHNNTDQPTTTPTTQPPTTEPVTQKPRLELFPLPDLPSNWNNPPKSEAPDELDDPEINWRELRSQAGHFHILMPGRPQMEHSSLNTNVGVVDMYYWSASQTPFSFVAMYADYPPSSIKEMDPQKILGNARDGAVANAAGSVLSDENIQLNGYPGREVRMSIKDGKMLGQGRFFLVRNRLFIVLCVTDRQHGFSANIHKFLNSFTLDEEENR